MELCLEARRALLPTEDERAQWTARELLAAAAGKTVQNLTANMRYYASDDIQNRLNDYVRRYLQGEPLAYICGTWDFHGMTLSVSPDVLIPRDDTEAVAELAIHRVKLMKRPNPRVLDLCAGSGCIGLAIAKEVPDARVTCAELSVAALKILRKNIMAQGLTGRVTPLCLDARTPATGFLGLFDLIVSNPPYVTRADMQTLPPEVRNYEPAMALNGGEDGLDFYRAIVENYGPAVRPGGWICFEFGLGQQEAVCRILQKGGFVIEQIKADSGNILRAVAAVKPETENDPGLPPDNKSQKL